MTTRAFCPLGTKCRECKNYLEHYRVLMAASGTHTIMQDMCETCARMTCTERTAQRNAQYRAAHK